MSARLPWKLLREAFAGEWVELVDYEWEWGAPVPKWGKVRSHASDRNSLVENMRAVEKNRSNPPAEGAQESVIFFVSPTPSIVMVEPTSAVV